MVADAAQVRFEPLHHLLYPLMSSQEISITVTHRSQSYNLNVDATATVQDLQERLSELTEVPAHLQKLLYKGKKNSPPDASLQSAGIVNGTKVTLLGNPESTIEGLREAEKQKKRKEDIIKARTSAASPKVRI
jgi:hypothetical protein